ncbi:MAG: DUF4258 domain-containing protein [bacterium]
MSKTFNTVCALIREGSVRISEHGYDELAADSLSAREVMAGVYDGFVVEDYPDYPKGPCVLVLQKDRDGQPIHVVWGIPKGHESPAVLVTAYRPNPDVWTDDFTRRRT